MKFDIWIKVKNNIWWSKATLEMTAQSDDHDLFLKVLLWKAASVVFSPLIKIQKQIPHSLLTPRQTDNLKNHFYTTVIGSVQGVLEDVQTERTWSSRDRLI